MTMKISEIFMLCWTSPWKYINTIKLNLHLYFRIRPGIPLHFIFNIFPKVYHTFGHTRTSILRLTDERRLPGGPEGNVMLNGPLRNYKDYQIVYINRLKRRWPWKPWKIVIMIFPNIYHTFGYTRTSSIPYTDKPRPPEEPQGNN